MSGTLSGQSRPLNGALKLLNGGFSKRYSLAATFQLLSAFSW